MKKITYFYMSGCPYCKNADEAIEELIKENGAYAQLEFDRIDETREAERTEGYDYYYIPTMFIGEEKKYEANPMQDYESIKASVKEVMDAAL